MSDLPIPGNRFYNAFDCQFLTRRRGADYRTPFERDRDRIIHSAALRRLQAKTQVFLSGEYDFYRTRLTHSIEVAQIGRSICHYLQRCSPLLASDFFVDPDLVEACCLAHDLGHPPFGHSGEGVLNSLMQPYGGFEGNAQTLRILTEIIYPDGPKRTGMKPTRALIDGVLKYKSLRGQLGEPERHFLYDDQAKYLRFVFDKLPYLSHFPPGPALNSFRSIECQIMDWADDTAYCLNDILDSIQARFLTREHIERWAGENPIDKSEARLLEKLLAAIRGGEIKRIFSRKIGDFITACQLKTRENFMSSRTNRYRFSLVVAPEIQKEANLYKRIASGLVFDSAQLQQLRYKWELVLEKMFIMMRDNYLKPGQNVHKLLPELAHRMVMESADHRLRMRLICDHIAGMTDQYAIRTFKRWFDPEFGSFSDLI